MQGLLGIPLPASTQWDIVHAQAKHLPPVHAEVIRQASEGDVLYNDDTTIKILELMGQRAEQNALAEDSPNGNAKKKQRSGLFTSGIYADAARRRLSRWLLTGPLNVGPGTRSCFLPARFASATENL